MPNTSLISYTLFPLIIVATLAQPKFKSPSISKKFAATTISTNSSTPLMLSINYSSHSEAPFSRRLLLLSGLVISFGSVSL